MVRSDKRTNFAHFKFAEPNLLSRDGKQERRLLPLLRFATTIIKLMFLEAEEIS